jgi:hypothetical protein
MSHPTQFIALNNEVRNWWWTFLENYLEGEQLDFRLQGNPLLTEDWRQITQRPTLFRPNSTLVSILNGLKNWRAALGFDSLFILVDGVDGYIETQSQRNLEALVAPLLNTLSLLSLEGVIWKFFFPDFLETKVIDSVGYKTRRVNLVSIKWYEYNLRQLLKLRLMWASDGHIQDIAQLCERELLLEVDVDHTLVQLALQHGQLGPPRTLLDLGNKLLQKPSSGNLLSRRDWENFLKYPVRQIKFSPYDEAQLFFTQAGFNTIELISSYELLCTSNLKLWKKYSPLYVWLAQELNVGEAHELLTGAKTAYGGNIRSRTAAIVIDQQPQAGVLHQILALRAQEALTVIPLPYSLIVQSRLDGRARAVLRYQIDLYMGRTDLYGTPGPVTDVLSFFGRKAQLASLQRWLTEGQSVITFGMRKIGKTSLMGRLEQECNWPIAVINLQGYSGNLGYVYKEALSRWQIVLKARFPELHLPKWVNHHSALNSAENAQAFREAVFELLDLLASQPGQPGILLFLDEADILFDKPEYLKFAAVLRSIVENPNYKGRFAILMAGLVPKLNRLDRIVGERNPFFAFFRELPIGPLSPDDTGTMIKSIGDFMGVKYTDQALEMLVSAGGGHPFLTRQLCSQAVENLKNSISVDAARVTEIMEKYLRQANNYLAESLWEIDNDGPPLAEAALISALATTHPQVEEALMPPDLSPKERRARQLALDHLKDQSLIRQVQDGWELTIPLYHHWIRRYILNLS